MSNMLKNIALAVFVFSLLGTGDTAITKWTTPITSTEVNASGVVRAVAENTNGSLGITFAATTAVSYAITQQIPANVFTINNTTGALAVSPKHVLDYETHQNYTVIVTAKGDTNSGTANIRIPISDVNDVAPAFAKPLYTVNVPDTYVNGVSVITVTATDKDGSSPNNVIKEYSLAAANNTNATFAVDPKNGTITVAKTLSAAKKRNYALVVKAVDSGTTPLTGSTTVNVCVGCQSGNSVQCVSLILILASVLFGIQPNARFI